MIPQKFAHDDNSNAKYVFTVKSLFFRGVPIFVDIVVSTIHEFKVTTKYFTPDTRKVYPIYSTPPLPSIKNNVAVIS